MFIVFFLSFSVGTLAGPERGRWTISAAPISTRSTVANFDNCWHIVFRTNGNRPRGWDNIVFCCWRWEATLFATDIELGAEGFLPKSDQSGVWQVADLLFKVSYYCFLCVLLLIITKICCFVRIWAYFCENVMFVVLINNLSKSVAPIEIFLNYFCVKIRAKFKRL